MNEVATYRKKQSRDDRLRWERGILSDISIHSNARLRRACKTLWRERSEATAA